MVIAKNPEAHSKLQISLNQGLKHYRALLRGQLKIKDSTQQWSWPISDKSEGCKNPQG